MTAISWTGLGLLVALTASGCDSKGQSTSPDGSPDAAVDGALADRAPNMADAADAPASAARDAAPDGEGTERPETGGDTAPTDGGDARPAGCPGGCPTGSVCVIPNYARGELWGACMGIPVECRPEAGDVGICNQCVGFTVCRGAFGCLAGGYRCGI